MRQGSERFHEILNDIGVLHDRKQADYGRPGDPFANVRGSEDFGVPGWVGALVRANDKMRRLQKAAQGGELANEGVVDSLMDLAVYALIALVLYEEDQEDGGQLPSDWQDWEDQWDIPTNEVLYPWPPTPPIDRVGPVDEDQVDTLEPDGWVGPLPAAAAAGWLAAERERARLRQEELRQPCSCGDPNCPGPGSGVV